MIAPSVALLALGALAVRAQQATELDLQYAQVRPSSRNLALQPFLRRVHFCVDLATVAALAQLKRQD